MPCAITSSSSTISTLAIAPSLARGTADYDLPVKAAQERELKLDVDPGFALPELGGGPLAPRTFTSTYFDTGSRRLIGAGITLCRRVEDRVGLWQLKLPSDDGRFEL